MALFEKNNELKFNSVRLITRATLVKSLGLCSEGATVIYSKLPISP